MGKLSICALGMRGPSDGARRRSINSTSRRLDRHSSPTKPFRMVVLRLQRNAQVRGRTVDGVTVELARLSGFRCDAADRCGRPFIPSFDEQPSGKGTDDILRRS